jgi:hypothetical protein
MINLRSQSKDWLLLVGLIGLAGLVGWLAPQDPVRTSDSVSIRLAFFILFGLSMLTALLFVRLFRHGTVGVGHR